MCFGFPNRNVSDCELGRPARELTDDINNQLHVTPYQSWQHTMIQMQAAMRMKYKKIKQFIAFDDFENWTFVSPKHLNSP